MRSSGGPSIRPHDVTDSRPGRHRLPLALLLPLALSGLTACSIRSLAINALASSLVASGDVFASDADPELIRDATPFALKTIESLLAERPEHSELLLAACRGFSQYAYAFVETEAERLEAQDFEAAEHHYGRALALYLRGRDYCLRAFELRLPGIGRRLRESPEVPLDALRVSDVPLLFWTGASWGGAIGIGQDRPELVADLPAVRVLMETALELDETYDRGAIHGVLLVLEALPETLGGSPERARFHFRRAVELSAGQNASPFVSLAETVAVVEQDWQEFQRLLDSALEIDPDRAPALRLANLIAQQRARWLLDRTGDLFLDFDPNGP